LEQLCIVSQPARNYAVTVDRYTYGLRFGVSDDVVKGGEMDYWSFKTIENYLRAPPLLMNFNFLYTILLLGFISTQCLIDVIPITD
jgi:hypothetical protein